MAFLVAFATALLLVVPVELPDKTFVATLVLATRYRPAPVWFGVTTAFGVQCLVAVVAGRLVSLLPERPVHLVTAGLFALGAGVLLRYVSLTMVQYVGAAVCAALAVMTLYGAFT